LTSASGQEVSSVSVQLIGPVLRALPTEVPAGAGFYKRAGMVEQGTPDEFEALAGRCPVFRRDPASTS
jgi:hypothetical protein